MKRLFLLRHAKAQPQDGAVEDFDRPLMLVGMQDAGAMARYLRTIVPLIKTTDRVLGGHWSSPARATSFDELRAEVALVQKRLDKEP